jgi:hypothetical protein
MRSIQREDMAAKTKPRTPPSSQNKRKPKVAKSKPTAAKRQREETAPTFPTWRERLEKKEQALRQEVEQFLEMVRSYNGCPRSRMVGGGI